MNYNKPPGRMKAAELIEELTEVHGKDAADLADMKWHALINLTKEARVAATPKAADKMNCEHPNYDPPTRLCLSCQARAPEDMILRDLAGKAVPEGSGVATHENRAESEEEEILRPLGKAKKPEKKAKDKPEPAPEPEPEPTPEPILETTGLLQIDPDTKDYRFDNHAGMGPSGAHRWINCTASVEASREWLGTLTLAQQEAFAQSGDAAAQGTTAHALAEAELLYQTGQIKKKKRDKIVARLSEGRAEVSYDAEMQGYVDEYVDFVMGYVRDHGMEAQVEVPVETVVTRADGSTYTIKGSADAALLPSDSHTGLVAVDLKYGVGHDVDPEENPQAMTYAGGLIQKYGIAPETEVTIVIAQPRLGGVKAWKTTAKHIINWIDNVLAPAADLALAGVDGGATFNPTDDGCTFCPAAPACKALIEKRHDEAKAAFVAVSEALAEGKDTVDGNLLSDERLGEVLDGAQRLGELAEKLKGEAERRMLAGRKIPNFKLVTYTPVRNWATEAKAGLVEIPEVWAEPNLLSPARALEAVKGDEKKTEQVSQYVVNPDNRPKIGRLSDKRKDWVGNTAAELFAPATEEEPKKAKKKAKKKGTKKK